MPKLATKKNTYKKYIKIRCAEFFLAFVLVSIISNARKTSYVMIFIYENNSNIY